MFSEHVKQFAVFGPCLVQRHFDEYRLRVFDCIQCGEQAVEVVRFAERFADMRVGAGDVDFDHRGSSCGPTHGGAVVFDTFVDVAAQLVVRPCDGYGYLHAFGFVPRAFRPGDHLLAAVVGQSDVHDHRIVFGQPVEPWLRIAGAGAGGGGADCFESESGVVEQYGHVTIFVEPRGQAERVVEVYAHNVGFENRVGVVEHFAQQPHERRDVAGDPAEFDHLVVRHVGRVVEHEERFDDVLVAESEKVGGCLVDGVVQRLFGNVTHTSYCGTVVSVFATNAGTVMHSLKPERCERGSMAASAELAAPVGGSVCVVMPTYNERENLRTTLDGVFAYNPGVDVLVVDDGSPDGTGELADRMARDNGHIHVVHRKGKGGLGPAYLAGFTWALDRGYDVVCEMDMDGSHRPQDLARMLRVIRCDRGVDLVIGSRRVPGGRTEGWPWYRDLISRCGSWYARLMLGIGVHDMTAGFRAYRADMLRSLDLRSVQANGYVFQIDMTRRVAAAGGRILEVPIVFPERRRGVSKMDSAIVAEAMRCVTVWGVARMRSACARGAGRRATRR